MERPKDRESEALWGRNEPYRVARETDRLLDQPVIKEAFRAARASHDAAERDRALRARAAFGIRTGAAADASDVYKARTEEARALTAAHRKRDRYARINDRIVPLLTGSAAERTRGNQLVQSLVEQNDAYGSCVIPNPLAAWAGWIELLVWHQRDHRDTCLVSRTVVEKRGAYGRPEEKRGYAIDLVQRLTPEQLRDLEPVTVRGLVLALAGGKDDSPWALEATQRDADLLDRWGTVVKAGGQTPEATAALDRLLSALPAGMYIRPGWEPGTRVLGFSPVTSPR